MLALRWTYAALIVPTIAAVGIACDRTTPTETLRPGDGRASYSVNGNGNGNDDSRLNAVPFVFVGRAGDCGAGTPAGSNIVTAAWLAGMGLPDNVGTTVADANEDDRRTGLLLNKNGPTPTCAASGARINGVRGMQVDLMFAVGFDYRGGGHCGAGAPRFNVVVRTPTGDELFAFVGGCANGVSIAAPQDPQWFRVRFPVALAFPPLPPGSRIESISILYDEGTDTPTLQDPMGVGLAVIDNIFLNCEFIRHGQGIAQAHGNPEPGRR
jgi:hypothetical protein